MRKKKQATSIGDGFDSILTLQRKCMFPFFHGSRFPGQGKANEKCFLFKMSTKAQGQECILLIVYINQGMVTCKNVWVHLDHTLRIDGWATMLCALYMTQGLCFLFSFFTFLPLDFDVLTECIIS